MNASLHDKLEAARIRTDNAYATLNRALEDFGKADASDTATLAAHADTIAKATRTWRESLADEKSVEQEFSMLSGAQPVAPVALFQ